MGLTAADLDVALELPSNEAVLAAVGAATAVSALGAPFATVFDIYRPREVQTPQADSLRIGEGAQRVQAPEGPSFGDRVEQLLEQTNQVQVNAEQASEAYANGTRNDMHGTMIALEEADITLRTMVAVRDKVVNAYQEVMNMAI